VVTRRSPSAKMRELPGNLQSYRGINKSHREIYKNDRGIYKSDRGIYKRREDLSRQTALPELQPDKIWLAHALTTVKQKTVGKLSERTNSNFLGKVRVHKCRYVPSPGLASDYLRIAEQRNRFRAASSHVVIGGLGEVGTRLLIRSGWVQHRIRNGEAKVRAEWICVRPLQLGPAPSARSVVPSRSPIRPPVYHGPTWSNRLPVG
jgi:hypothetical protein